MTQVVFRSKQNTVDCKSAVVTQEKKSICSETH